MSELTAAIYFQADAYSTNTPKLMGRNAAGESFINGFLSHSQYKTLYAQVNQVDDAEYFGQIAKRLDVQKPIKFILPDQYGALNEVQTLYYPGPDIDSWPF